MDQKIIPAISNHSDMRKFLTLPLTYGILMNFQLAQLPDLIKTMKDSGKKVLIHSELIKGLSSDEYGAIYLIQTLKVDGLISSKPKVIETCKKRKVLGVFRFFLKDRVSLEQSIIMANQIKPEYIEVLPSYGVGIIEYLKEKVDSKFLVGGLIGDKKHLDYCLKSGALAVTISNSDLWE